MLHEQNCSSSEDSEVVLQVVAFNETSKTVRVLWLII